MKICSSVILVFASSIYLHGQSDCKLKKDQDSIRVYTCHTDTSRFKSILAEFTVNTTSGELAQFVMDIPGYTRWQYNTIEAKTIKNISSSEQIYHTVIEAPWPVSDRDMVVHIRTTFDEDGKGVSITTDSKRELLPEKQGLVRVPSSHAVWIVKQKNKNQLQIKYTMQIDPGGSVPAWLVNWVCAQAPYQSFKNLKAILEKRK